MLFVHLGLGQLEMEHSAVEQSAVGEAKCYLMDFANNALTSIIKVHMVEIA